MSNGVETIVETIPPLVATKIVADIGMKIPKMMKKKKKKKRCKK